MSVVIGNPPGVGGLKTCESSPNTGAIGKATAPHGAAAQRSAPPEQQRSGQRSEGAHANLVDASDPGNLPITRRIGLP
jgi:hypothetical protein